MPPSIDQTVPVGPAQAPSSGGVTTGPAGAGVRIAGTTSQFFKFASLEGFDNARAVIEAVPAADADFDLYVQRREDEGS